MRSFVVLCCLGLTGGTSCGADEALTSRKLDAGLDLPAGASVDLCRALDALVSVPGATERLCALNQATPGSPESVPPCERCAAQATAVQALLPDLSCPGRVEACQVGDEELRDCFETVGQILTEVLPGCGPTQAPVVDTSTLVLRIGASSCAPVLLDCPPLQDLVFGLVGASL